jgi:hypothetical protein
LLAWQRKLGLLIENAFMVCRRSRHGAHVHCVANRFSNHRVGAMHAPGKTVTLGGGIYLVFLGGIEVG